MWPGADFMRDTLAPQQVLTRDQDNLALQAAPEYLAPAQKALMKSALGG